MQVNMNNNNPNFGVLYVHKGLPIGKTYRTNECIMGLAEESIKNSAKDADVHIFFRNFLTKGFDIKVGNIVDSPVKRFFHIFGITEDRKIRPNMFTEKSAPDLLVEEVFDAKDSYHKFKKYNNSDKYKGSSEENTVFEVVIDGQTYYKRYNNSES